MPGALILALVAIGLSAPAEAQPIGSAGPPAGLEPVAMTRHQIRVGGQPLDYTAEAGRIAIRDAETGDLHAYMFYVAYRVPSAPGPRPIVFVWNGGPGVPSATLHFELAGPKRDEGDHLVDNEETFLTFADVVVVDMVGTGFSRLAKKEYASEFYGTPADVRAFTEFVRCWRLDHDAEDARIFLFGESFGAGRAGSVSYLLAKQGINVSGVVLVSGATGLPSGIPAAMRDALHVADLTQTAFQFGKTAPELGKNPDAIRAAAERWARETYLPALERADSLSDAERSSIVDQLSRYTGMPAGQIDRNTLRFSPRAYLVNLRKDEAKTLNIYDMRLDAEPKPTAVQAQLRYLRRELAYDSDLPYVGLESYADGFAPSGAPVEDINHRWDWSTAKMTPGEVAAAIKHATEAGDGPPRLGPPLPSTAEAIAINPGMRALIANGIYDSYASCAANEEMMRRLPAGLQRVVTFRCYDGGHMMYRDPAVRVRFSHDVRAFIAAK